MIRVENATKLYGRADAKGTAVHALNGVSLRIEGGEFVARPKADPLLAQALDPPAQ